MLTSVFPPPPPVKLKTGASPVPDFRRNALASGHTGELLRIPEGSKRVVSGACSLRVTAISGKCSSCLWEELDQRIHFPEVSLRKRRAPASYPERVLSSNQGDIRGPPRLSSSASHRQDHKRSFENLWEYRAGGC